MGACAAPVIETDIEQILEEPIIEEILAVELEPVASMATDEELDAAFAPFLDAMPGYGTIKVADLSALLAEEDIFLLDVRQPEELEEKGHIEGAVHIPLRELAQNVDLLPSFDTTVVAYCGSGWRSTIAMTALEGLGWTDARSLKGGIGGWVDAGNPVVDGLPPEAEVLSAAEPDLALLMSIDDNLATIPEGWGVITTESLAEELADSPDLILLDVRREDELAEKGWLENATHIPIEAFVVGAADWPADYDAPIVVYCGSGHRSTIAMTILRTYGYTDVRSLKGGFGGWVAAGNPSVGGLNNAYTAFLDDMEGYGIITVEGLNELLAEEDVFLLDVRQPEELEEKGHIEGAVHIPLRELGQNLDLLPDFDTTIVTYCGSGWRSGLSMTGLEALGWTDVRSLKGGFGAWAGAGNPVVEGLPPEPEALAVAEPEPMTLTKIDGMFSSLPEGWGVLTVEGLSETLAESPDVVLIDVRKPEELTESGQIEGAISIPLEEFMAMQGEWPADKDAQIVVYCKAGHRGNIAATILRSYGYGNVQNLKGGFTAWVDAGSPVVMTATAWLDLAMAA
jgi:rhodanese-related sulfurtransferase